MLIQFSPFISILLLILLAILPLVVWPATRRASPIYLTLAVWFCLYYSGFLRGETGLRHDSYLNQQLPFERIFAWFKAGYRWDWNPFVGGGQPLALLNNIYFYPTHLGPGLILEAIGVNLPPAIMQNHLWVFAFLNFLTGSALLIHLWFGMTSVTLLGYLEPV